MYSQACKSLIKTIDFSKQQHTWLEWFSIFNYVIKNASNEKAKEYIFCIINIWTRSTEHIKKEIDKILNNQFLLKSNNLMNENLYFQIVELKDACEDYFHEEFVLAFAVRALILCGWNLR